MTIVLTRDGFWISPYVFSCYVTLREKNLDFEVREIALQKKAQLDPAYAMSTITARVPSLTHDGFTIAESSAIVEYLEDTFISPRVLPENTKERARARQLMSWIRSDDTLPIREERSTHTMFYEHTKTPFTENARAAAAKLVAVAERAIPAGKTQLFSQWSIADADLAFILQRLIMNDDEVPSRVRAFVDAQWSRPSVRAFVDQERAPYVPYG